MILLETAIAIQPMGKARPRVTKRGTYMPDSYTAWKKMFAVLMLEHRHLTERPITGAIRIGTVFYTKNGNCRCDLDNAHASVLDALQDAGWIENDRQVKAGFYAIEQRPTPLLAIRIESIPAPHTGTNAP